MAYVLTEPQVVAAAAADVAGIGSAISEANAAAAGQTTAFAAAAADEVSASTSTLFSAYAQEYHAVIAQAAAFHNEFVAALAAAGDAYAQTEAASLSALTSPLRALSAGPLTGSAASSATGGANAVIATVKQALSGPSDPDITLVIGGSGNPIPGARYITNMVNNYVTPNFPSFTLPNAQVLYNPNGAYPIYPLGNGVKGLTFVDSVTQGVTILNDTIVGTGVGQHGIIIPGGNPVVVTGFSQSTVVSSLEMEQLATMGAGAPTANQLGFVLLADPMNPNGGLFERFVGLTFPSFGLTYYGATPPNTIYPTDIYSIEYDGYADFPQYPINFLSDLNAVAGIYYLHPLNPYLNPAALPSGFGIQTLPTSPGYTGVTTYNMITVPNLPLLDPVRAIPVIGNPLADLLQPDLTVLVNLGYGSPSQGWSTGYANVPTPFELFPPINAHTVLADLATGTQQGISAAGSALGTEVAQGLASLSGLSPSGIGWDISNVLTSNPLATLSALPTALTSGSPIVNGLTALDTAVTNVVNAITSASSTAYATLLPTADAANVLLTTVPTYDFSLFVDGIIQMLDGQPLLGLVNAFGMPVAADVALYTIVGATEGLVLVGAARSIVSDFTSLL